LYYVFAFVAVSPQAYGEGNGAIANLGKYLENSGIAIDAVKILQAKPILCVISHKP